MQSYISLPKIISRQINYYIVFKINDRRSIGTIVANHNIDDVGKQVIFRAYNSDATATRGDFFMFDLKIEKTRFRHNFLNILNLKYNVKYLYIMVFNQQFGDISKITIQSAGALFLLLVVIAYKVFRSRIHLLSRCCKEKFVLETINSQSSLQFVPTSSEDKTGTI